MITHTREKKGDCDLGIKSVWKSDAKSYWNNYVLKKSVSERINFFPVTIHLPISPFIAAILYFDCISALGEMLFSIVLKKYIENIFAVFYLFKYSLIVTIGFLTISCYLTNRKNKN